MGIGSVSLATLPEATLNSGITTLARRQFAEHFRLNFAWIIRFLGAIKSLLAISMADIEEVATASSIFPTVHSLAVFVRSVTCMLNSKEEVTTGRNSKSPSPSSLWQQGAALCSIFSYSSLTLRADLTLRMTRCIASTPPPAHRPRLDDDISILLLLLAIIVAAMTPQSRFFLLPSSLSFLVLQK
jgi:hypothetical protein